MKKVLLLLMLFPLFFGACKKDEAVNYPESIENSVWETKTIIDKNKDELKMRLSFLPNGVMKVVFLLENSSTSLVMGVTNSQYYNYSKSDGRVYVSGHFDFYDKGYFLNRKTGEYTYLSEFSDSFKEENFSSLSDINFNFESGVLKIDGDKMTEVSNPDWVFYRK